MKSPNDRSNLEEDICIHIFTVSAAMVGVCLTVIGLLRVVISMRRSDTAADNIVSTDAILFLISRLSSYLGAAHAQYAPDASRGAFRRPRVHPRHVPDGVHLRLHHAFDSGFLTQRIAPALARE